MDTDFKFIKCKASQTSPEGILSSGEFFSGSIRFANNKNEWVIFNLVNKELMEYILSDISFSDEVMLEIFSYDEDTKNVQHPSNWEESI